MDDPFASLRIANTGSCELPVEPLHKHEKHLLHAPVFAGKPQKTADKHLKHEKHREIDGEPENGVRDVSRVPPEWRDGLAMLRGLNARPAFEPDRWRRLVDDTVREAVRSQHWATKFGWTMADLFAFDPHPERVHVGAMLKVGGGRLTILDERQAAIRGRDGGWQWHHRLGCHAIPDDAPLIWQPERWQQFWVSL